MPLFFIGRFAGYSLRMDLKNESCRIMLCPTVNPQGGNVKNWRLFWYQLNEKLGRWGGHLLFAACAAGSVFVSCLTFMSGNIFLVFVTAACGLVTGLVFIRVYLPGIAEYMAFGLVFPQRYLKEAPLILSPIHGLITNGRYEEAEMKLLELQAEYSADSEVVSALVDLYADKHPSPDALAAIVECYLLQNPPRRDDLHIFILMRYADCVTGGGDPEKLSRLAAFMKRELKKRNHLTPPEKKAVQERLNTIENQLQGKGGGGCPNRFMHS